MRSPHDVIVAPLITEKTTLMKEKGPVLAFRVDRRANKVEIRQAVERLFKVKVASVRTQNAWGKRKRVGRYEGRRSDWKKAYVTLKAGEKPIEYFEAV
jgi:large subunit ribosomal protein L23